MTNYEIRVVDNDFIKTRWDEIESELKKAFKNSEMSDEFANSRPIQHTWEEINKTVEIYFKHVIAINSDGKLRGAFFCVPSSKDEHETNCDLGWFFTSAYLLPEERRAIADKIVEKTHEVMRQAGFKKVITEMGSKAGARFLSERHGYVCRPTKDKKNRWVKVLNRVS